ncbi:hypothetical protein [Petroclostridium xylanilyticum]|uniref:hypothetical protein n=1 Tax=Petroclostridium xylanilyticum TaxID=1792311 RepID=UPI000B98CD71|nr:hypothetical protein [Petroclostridium xylanilyticum]
MLSLKLLIGFFGEGILTAYVCPKLIGAKLSPKQILTIGIIYGLFIYLTRSAYSVFKIPLGTHTLILLCVLTLLFKYLGKISFLESFIAMFIAEGLLVIGENVFALSYLTWIKIPFKQLNNTWYHVLLIYITNLPMIIMGIIIRFMDFKFMDSLRDLLKM